MIIKKFIRRFCIFGFVSLFFYVVGINLWEEIVPPPYKPNLLYKVGDGLVSLKVKESEEIDSLDILFLGSSHAYVAFDPRIYQKEGIKSFNWGTTKQTHVQTRLIMDAYLDKFKPKLVVYEVFPEIFALDGIESTIDFLNSNRSFDQNVVDYIFQENGLKVLNTYIIKYSRQNFLNIDDSNKDKDEFQNLTYVKGGYVESTWQNPFKLTNKQREQYLTIKWEPREEQLEAFEENLKILKQKNIPYILVIVPYVFQYQNQEKIDVYFKDKGIFYDYNKLMNFRENAHFSDFHHLNKSGAERLNSHLIEMVREKYLD